MEGHRVANLLGDSVLLKELPLTFQLPVFSHRTTHSYNWLLAMCTAALRKGEILLPKKEKK